MLDDQNPYAAPLAMLKRAGPSPEATYLGLFLTWEKLRLVYNSVLAVETMTLLQMFPPKRANLTTLALLAFACVAANVCFCVGPVLNGYAHWMGFRHPAVRTGLFIAGMLLAFFLAALVVIKLNLPIPRI
jgi:hypothetical protein